MKAKSSRAAAAKAEIAVKHKKGRRILGSERDELAAELLTNYTAGHSIRALTESTGRSYGFVYRVLTEKNAPLQGRGGPMRQGSSKS